MPEQTPDTFDRFWDSVAAGLTGELTGVDPIQAETVRRFHAVEDVSGPEPTFLDRLEEDLGLSSAESRAIRSGAYPRSSMNGYSVSPSRRPPLRAAHIPQERRWGLAAGAVAALLLIFGIGYVLFGSELLDDDQRTTVPAAVEPTATPTPDVRSEGTVVEVTIPADVLPAGEAGSSLVHFTLLPGSQSTWTVFQNTSLNAVLEGTLVVRSRSPIQVLRASGDGEWETIPGGAEVSLGPGDLVLLLTVTTADFDNPGDVPVELVQWGLAVGTSSEGPMPMSWVVNDYALSGGSVGGGVSLTGEPAMLRLQRKVLAPGASIPAAPKGVLQLVTAMPDNGAGTPVAASFLVRGIRGKADNYGKNPMLVYVLTLTFAVPDGSPPAGTPPP